MNDKSVSDDEEVEEGARLLLNGLCFSDLRLSRWDEIDVNSEYFCEQAQDLEQQEKVVTLNTKVLYQIEAQEVVDDALIFEHAYRISSDGCCQSPYVKVVNLPGKGKALVSTHFIPKGCVLYTEEAAVAAQLPEAEQYSVRACQSCFCSLEPISKLTKATVVSSQFNTFPLPYLWPVSEYEALEVDFSTVKSAFITDKIGRVLCHTCKTWYCSQRCFENFANKFGKASCCGLLDLANKKILSFLGSLESSSPVVLATRMFAMSVQRYRSNSTEC